MPNSDDSPGSMRRRTRPNEPLETSTTALSRRNTSTRRARTADESRWYNGPRIWALDIFGQSMHYMKRPLSLLLSVGILCLVFMLIWAFVKPNFCSIPIISYTHVCSVRTEPAIELTNAFRMQSKLADVRMISDRSSELPFAINDGQLAMMDIDIAIVNSDIPGRAEISRLLNDFMDLGQSTVFELMKYHASCVASVDFALSLNYWTKRSLQEIEAKYSTPISLAWNNALSIVGGKTKMGSVQRIYFWYTEDLHLELRGLITQGERLTRDLRTLIEKLKSALAILGLEQKISSAKTQDLDTIWARIFQLHRTELQVMKNQLGLMTGLISDIKRARKGTADTTDKLRSINVEVRSLYEVLVRPGKHLMLNNADIGYYLSEIETLIGILEKGRTKVKSYSQKNMTSLGLNK